MIEFKRRVDGLLCGHEIKNIVDSLNLAPEQYRFFEKYITNDRMQLDDLDILLRIIGNKNAKENS